MEEVVDVALQNGPVLVGYTHPRLVEVADHRLDAFADGGAVLRGALGRPAVDELVELVGRSGADEDVDVTLAVEQALDQVPPDEPCPPGHETRHCRTLSRHARLPRQLPAGCPPRAVTHLRLLLPGPRRRQTGSRRAARPPASAGRIRPRARCRRPGACPVPRSPRGGPRASSPAGSGRAPRRTPARARGGVPAR